MDWRQPRGTNMRLVAVGVCLIALTGAYILMLRHFNVSELPGERHFGAVDGAEPAGEVYLEPVSIDALNDAMQMRAYLSPSLTQSKDAHSAPSRDLTLLVTHDKTVEEVKLAAGDHIASLTFEIDLNDGTVAHYPLDAYRTQLGVQLLDGKSSLQLPVRVTMWEGVLGYNLHTTDQPQTGPEDVELTTTIRRSGAFALFGLCAYAAMIVLGSCAIVIGVLTFTGVRSLETQLIGSLAAIAFALPVLRNALPGQPPLGVQADMWVFLWAELAAVLALALVVYQWARAGPRR
jgi:energy-converting hydrogenase Eha subunit E